MANQTKKYIIISLIAILSLALIFLIIKIAIAPTTSTLLKIPAPNPVPAVNDSSINNSLENTQAIVTKEWEPITLIFGGDVMLSRQVNDRINKNNDYSWPFIKISDLLSSADITIINLESPFIKRNNYFVPTGSFLFKANPESISGLTKSGVDLVSLANNHILNQGADGLSETQEILGNAGIKTIGAGANEEAARQPAIFTINNKTIGFLAYAYPNDNSVASTSRPGIATMDLVKLSTDIKKLKNKADIVIIIMHAGEEYTTKPNAQQITFAHTAIESGADLVIGHHPHWPQTWEYYQGKPIIYSLGNLIFDQMWSKETSQGIIAKVSWTEEQSKVEIIPIKIKDYGQAEIMEASLEKEALFKKLNIPSDGIIPPDSQ